MGTRLYVANLPDAPSTSALRTHFGTCGTVADVQIVLDRNTGRGRASAFVRMGSAAAAQRAVSELNRAPFGGQLLIVEAAPDQPGDGRGGSTRRDKKDDEDRSAARITQQLRGPDNMTYELDCSSVTVVIRSFFPTANGEWRIVMQAGHEADAQVASASTSSRIESFRGAVRACREGIGVSGLGLVDWEAVEAALLKVRAL
jgi:RNA recognition motif-containing protein